MRQLSCIVVDDEHLALELLEDYIQKIPNLTLMDSCSNAMDAISILQKQKIDLIFLDVQMPDLLGTELVRTLSNRPMIVFTTAYSDFAVESYDLQAVDYLVKPIEFERFVQAVNKAHDQYSLRISEASRKSENGSYLLVKADHGIHKVLHREILYIEGLQEYVIIRMTGNRKLITLMTLAKLEEELSDDFLRVHRSYIVNVEKVNSLFGSKVLIENVSIPIGKRYRDTVLSSIFRQ